MFGNRLKVSFRSLFNGQIFVAVRKKLKLGLVITLTFSENVGKEFIKMVYSKKNKHKKHSNSVSTDCNTN